MKYPFLSMFLEITETTGLRSQGKIFVVIAVIALIFMGLSIYLIAMDRRIKKLENKANKKTN